MPFPSYSVTKNKRNQSQREYFVSFIQNIRKSSNISKYLAFGICLCLKTASFSILNKNWFDRILKANVYFLAWSIVDELFIDYIRKKEKIVNWKHKTFGWKLILSLVSYHWQGFSVFIQQIWDHRLVGNIRTTCIL